MDVLLRHAELHINLTMHSSCAPEIYRPEAFYCAGLQQEMALLGQEHHSRVAKQHQKLCISLQVITVLGPPQSPRTFLVTWTLGFFQILKLSIS